MNLFFYFFIVLLLCFSTAVDSRVVEKTLKVVQGEMITLLDLQEARKRIHAGLMKDFTVLSLFKKNELKKSDKKMLEYLIYEKLIDIDKQIQEGKLKTTDKQIQAEVEIRRKQTRLSKKAFSKKLVKNGFTASSYKNFLKKELLRRMLVNIEVREKVRISDQDLNDYAIQKERKALFSSFEYELAYLLFPLTSAGRQTAEKTYKMLIKDPKIFDEWQSKSLSKGKKETLGKKTLSAMHPSIRKAVKELSIGQFSPVLCLSTGCHIFKLIWKNPVITAKNQKRKNKLFVQLSKKLFQEELKNWLNNKKQKVFIQNPLK